MCSLICTAYAANNQFSDNFNNGCRLLSSMLLFQMIFNFKRWLEAEAYFRRQRALLTNYTQGDDYVCIWHQVPAQ